MDIERVNIVFNYDMPEDSDTYLHRVSVLRNGFVYGAVCFFFVVGVFVNVTPPASPPVRLPVQVDLEPKVWP